MGDLDHETHEKSRNPRKGFRAFRGLSWLSWSKLPLDEQRRIVEYLDAVQAKIEAIRHYQEESGRRSRP
jgi:hypothetical protein